ncbi:MAG: hypothetical protein RR101_14715, partial [Burkholderiaceae bacterium]
PSPMKEFYAQSTTAEYTWLGGLAVLTGSFFLGSPGLGVIAGLAVVGGIVAQLTLRTKAYYAYVDHLKSLPKETLIACASSPEYDEVEQDEMVNVLNKYHTGWSLELEGPRG